ncbi:eukaryotic translation initiation factor 3 subunit K, putative [Plasmodium vivax]|uniref:Eukaryotic translation initiation factor 3 subunit K n=3 Tax=Plasmodium vivax TaxID=5855 RepID=A5KBB9_PLAVS|nr:eukaryotic translation initiation factor 3 subunit 11, putative [Plasmodium vivax]EDL43397.1 eukaryotic translation initiation factor 3 subunit 11, putative [Plasmodium vivax]KMZ86763.1 eukaryotic translation initiation factor 3 subunit 11 [Plasmodium vivax Brazil I]KMZ93592.1 eukaryotic translation initiation factor 3 subunit 11 [Plasmodium vivax Mauritania I]CAI7720198.1 eukaryotic translation initiation factor 3 subunit K, putative [Plasmodium vivax]|eukprot:XP_001613124.1 eukaryotic translation initiation factor 3 subunit 11 [Plasmodium vivax Sal-1]
MDVKSIIEEVQAIKVYPHMMFNASKLKTLSDYVDIAFGNNEYFDNEVMLTLLRLFCLYPHCFDKIVIKKILVCVLYNINEVDMNTYLSLINPNLYDEHIRSVVYLYDLIKECHFIKLWSCINNNQGMDNRSCDYSFLANHDSFICNVRKYILNCITLSFENISLQNMATYLNYKDMNELEKFLNENKWTVKKATHKEEEVQVCSNGNIETMQQSKKSINAYFNEDNISSYINKLNN